MARRDKDTFDKVKEAVLIAVTIGTLSAAVKTYLDVQELKVRFDYVYGRWAVPEKKS